MRELAHTRQHSWSSKSGKHYCFLAELRLGNPVAPGRKGECRREPHTGPHRALWVPRIAVQLRGDWSLLVPPESSRCPWRRRRRLQACTRAAITTASGTRIQSWRAPACRSSRQIGADQLCLQRSRSGQRLRADRQRQVVHARGHQPDSQHDRPAAAGHEASAPSRAQPAAPMMNSARMSHRRRALPVVPYRSRAARRRTFSNMACGDAKESVG